MNKYRFLIAALVLFILPVAWGSGAGFTSNHVKVAHAATTLVVNSTADDADATPGDGICQTLAGTCTLRAAIHEANALAGTDTINFNIPACGGVCTIAPLSTLPDVTGPTIIDGYTQPGSAKNTLAVGNNAVLRIELNGANAGLAVDGITLQGGSTVRGLIINGFLDQGNLRGNGISQKFVGNNIITGNFIGTNANGTAANSNFNGIFFTPTGSQVNTRIGGTLPEERNLVSGNRNCGLVISTTANNIVQGNYIGTNASGTAAIGNVAPGVCVVNSSSGNTVGGLTAAARNVISGNANHGIVIHTGANGNFVQGNFVGTQADGISPLANNGVGVFISGPISGATSNNSVGGTVVGAGNTIAFNADDGVRVAGAPNNAFGNAIRGNSIHTNFGKGIRNTFGGNMELAPPVITSATGTTVAGTTSCSGCSVDVYQDAVDEGQTFLGSVLFVGNNWTFPGTISGSQKVTATVTDSAGNTSEFSAPVAVTAAPPGSQTYVVNNIGDAPDAVLDGVCQTATPGVCTLRAAIQEANAHANVGGPDTINFNITSGCATVCTMTLATTMTQITESVVINGYSQPDSVKNTAAQGSNAVLKIEVRGAAGFGGIDIAAPGGVTVSGLVLNGFTGSGAAIITRGSNNIVTGNFIGTNASGTAASANEYGVYIAGIGDRIGGSALADRNVISGNSHSGVRIFAGNLALVQGNVIGTNAAGTTAITNGYGILINGGDTSPATINANLISGNAFGITIGSGGTHVVKGNLIGTSAAGTAAVPNSVGVSIENTANNAVGGLPPADRNTIAFNNNDGVRVSGASATGNAIRGNSIHDNTGKGIENINGGNGEPVPPTVTSATASAASGTACPGCFVDVFSDATDEGAKFHGSVTADGAGAWSVSSLADVLTNVTATATNGAGNTSEFSAPRAVGPAGIAPIFTSLSVTTFTVGAAGNFPVTATGTPAPTITTTTPLPGWLTLLPSGLLSGTPPSAVPPSYVIALKASNGVGLDATQSFTLTVSSASVAPAITSLPSATFTIGVAGSFTITTSGPPPIAISQIALAGPPLPAGVTFTDNGNGTATLAGTPASNAGGSYGSRIKASNGTAPDALQTFTLTVNPPNSAPAITSTNATTFTVGQFKSFNVIASGFPFSTFSQTGVLPSGLTLSSGGVLSGTPAAGTANTYPIVITANNGIGSPATQSFTLTVMPAGIAPAITSLPSATFTVGTPGSFNVTATGTPAPTITTVSALPGGVTLSPSGLLSGIPAPGSLPSYVIALKASNGVSPDATQSFTLTVNPAANYVVTKTADTNSACSPTDCSLRAAISAANAHPGPDTIFVPAGIYNLTISGGNEDANATGDLDITGDLTIIGAGAALTIVDGAAIHDRVFEVHLGTTVKIDGVTIQNGDARNAGGSGGGIFTKGTLTLSNSIVKGNNGLDAGGIYNLNGTLSVTKSTITGNSTFYYAGGIFNHGNAPAVLTLTDSTVSDNFSGGYRGAGLANVAGVVVAANSTISGNKSSGQGAGGILNWAGGQLTLANSTISGNIGTYYGGAISNSNYGGGISAVTLVNSTVMGNTDLQASLPGGIFNDSGGYAGTVTLKNTIIAQSSTNNCSGVVAISLGNNIVDDSSCALTGPGDRNSTNPVLGPLANNGGPTQTHAPLLGSPAINGVPSASCTGLNNAPLASDQRGTNRPQGGACDIGAVEMTTAELAATDTDSDGIANNVDRSCAGTDYAANPGAAAPGTAGNSAFSDMGALGGKTCGIISDRGSHTLAISDASPNPGGGINIVAGGANTTPAQVQILNTPIKLLNNGIYLLNDPVQTVSVGVGGGGMAEITYTINGVTQIYVVNNGGAATFTETTNASGQLSGVQAAALAGVVTLNGTPLPVPPPPVAGPNPSEGKLKADLDTKRDRFDLDATFTLGPGSDGISPASEPVLLQVGGYNVIIPAGSFKAEGKSKWTYKGTIAGAKLEVEIRRNDDKNDDRGNNDKDKKDDKKKPVVSYDIKVKAQNVTTVGNASPITVTIAVGLDGASTTVKLDKDGKGHGDDDGHR